MLPAPPEPRSALTADARSWLSGAAERIDAVLRRPAAGWVVGVNLGVKPESIGLPPYHREAYFVLLSYCPTTSVRASTIET